MNNKIYILFPVISLASISMYGMDKRPQNTYDNSYENVHLYTNDNRQKKPYRMEMPQGKPKHTKTKSERVQLNQDRRYKIDYLNSHAS